MKRYIKMFEEFISEGDPFADLDMGLDGDKEKKDEKPKEDPLDLEKKKQKAKEAELEKKHDTRIDDAIVDIKNILKSHPNISDKIIDTVNTALKDSDRTLIHNAINDIIYLQQKYQEAGDNDSIQILSKVKVKLDDFDKSFSNDKFT